MVDLPSTLPGIFSSGKACAFSLAFTIFSMKLSSSVAFPTDHESMHHGSSLPVSSFDGKNSLYILNFTSRSIAYSMKQIAVPILGAAIFSCSGFAYSQDESDAQKAQLPSAAEVQEKLRQWVRTQQLISKERSDWDADKRALADLNELRDREVAQLDELIEAAGSRLTDAETRRAELVAEEEKLRSQRSDLEKSIAGFETSADELLLAFPAPLRKQLADAIERLGSSDAADTPLQNRYRDVLAVIIEAGAFDSRLTLDAELRDFDGKSIKVDVLYLGLGQAYYTDRAGIIAGTGKPGADGWTWTERPELAASIRKTLDVFQKQASPVLVELPLQLSLEK